MSELKTLKDLEDWELEKDGYIPVSSKLLKAEAVKWVKEDIKEYKNMFNDVLKGRDIKSPTMNLIKKWMERLNISEEDLK